MSERPPGTIDMLPGLSSTRRATVSALEGLLYEPMPVLDHGFIRIIDYMGNDAAIVQAARVSYGTGTKGVSGDQGLINYLMRHRHTTPFEMCEIKLHVKLPIFVARQWIRHRTANVNECSARYSVMSREYHVPESWNIGPQSTANKQGRGPGPFGNASSNAMVTIEDACERSFAAYDKLLGDEVEPGIAREQARMVLPLNTFTEMYWKIDLHNLLHFIALRADKHAQHEIQAYADVLLDIVRMWVPLTAAAFDEYRGSDAAELSATALDVVRRRLRGEVVTREDVDMAPREWRELEKLLGQEEVNG